MEDKSLEMAISQIERQFGKGAIMRLGTDNIQQIGAISTGALALDLALGIGGVPRAGSSRFSAPRAAARRRWRSTSSPRPSAMAASPPSSTPSTPLTLATPQHWVSMSMSCSSRNRTQGSRHSRSRTC